MRSTDAIVAAVPAAVPVRPTHTYHLAVLVALMCLAVTAPMFGQVPGKSVRQHLLFDFGWRFHLGDAASAEGDFGYGAHASFAKAGDAAGAAKPDFNDSSWRKVNLPHDWAVELEFVNVSDEDVRSHGYKPMGRRFPKTTIGWYRRAFVIPGEDKGKRLTLKFDGVFRDCVVWLNGHFLGRNLSGYNEFNFDITDYLKYGGRNVVVLRVDASQYEGWFYEGAGIYRHVWLLKTAPLHIPLYGIFVSTETADPDSAGTRVNIETRILNENDARASCMLVSTVTGDDGTVFGRASSVLLNLAPNEQRILRQSITVSNPRLWSVESPHLYKLVSTVHLGQDTLDRVETPFGIRTVRFDKDSGLFLNGKPLKIKGVCCHQDHAGVGSALPDGLQYFRIKKLKEMGCNAYRTSHNPPTPELLEACDRLGMLVMDENRLMGSTPELVAQLQGLILRDRNHPSVMIWSLGNEEWWIQNNEAGRNIARSLKRVQKEFDPTRLCTFAADNGDRYEGVNSVVDVRGVNYIGRGDIDKYHREHPDQPLLGSEEASTYCTRGIYSNDTLNGFVSDEDVNAPGYGSLAEPWWKYCAARIWMAGAFVWTGFDYRGEPSPYDWPCISSHFGIVDVCGFPKNNFYYYQSWWSDKDVLHLAPHWNWSGRVGQPIDVWCQSNCDSVELSLNGRSLGRKIMERNSHLQWKAPYEPGTLEARGWRKGRTIRTKVETTGEPAAIRFTPDRSAIRADGEDVCVVEVNALDREGREIAIAESPIRFELEGDGAIIGVGNGNPSSHEPDKYLVGGYRRKLFGGKCQVIIQAGRLAGGMSLKGFSDGLKTATLRIKTEASEPRPFLSE